MDDNETALEVQPCPQRTMAVAFIASFVSLALFYWAASPVVDLLEVRWIEWMVYGIIPLTITFVVLYRSGWHREITGAARTCSVLLLSCAVLSGELMVIGLMLVLALFCLMGITGGNH